MRPVLIQSHRGAGVLAPENTLEAFELAWRMGTVPEADVRTTRDGVIVAFHDRDFSRVVSHLAPELRDCGVESVTFEQLSQMDVSEEHPGLAGHRPIALQQAFAALCAQPERQLYLDIKDVGLDELATLVFGCGVGAQVIFASTRYEAHREWKQLMPESKTLLWMGGDDNHLEERLERLRRMDFADISQLQIHVHFDTREAIPTFSPSESWLCSLGEELRSRGILFQVLPWGARDPAIYERLLQLGVESFATDYPDVVLEVVRRFKKTRNGVAPHLRHMRKSSFGL
jgi:glycerophosphoryl diester phosphodiesterase